VLAGPEEEAAWLSGELDAAALGELLVPLDAGRTGAAPANPAVNRAGVEGEELLVPPPPPAPETQLTLGL
jgi:putative SOS response-associated peptidase YedK